jgi:hypothetical protein
MKGKAVLVTGFGELVLEGDSKSLQLLQVAGPFF